MTYIPVPFGVSGVWELAVHDPRQGLPSYAPIKQPVVHQGPPHAPRQSKAHTDIRFQKLRDRQRLAAGSELGLQWHFSLCLEISWGLEKMESSVWVLLWVYRTDHLPGGHRPSQTAALFLEGDPIGDL